MEIFQNPIVRAWGMNAEEVLTRKAFSEPHAVYSSGEHEEQAIRELTNALKDMMRKELSTPPKRKAGTKW